jgi:hypothetical protein
MDSVHSVRLAGRTTSTRWDQRWPWRGERPTLIEPIRLIGTSSMKIWRRPRRVFAGSI